MRLYAPCHSELLYPHTSGLTTNSSRIDLDADYAPEGEAAQGRPEGETAQGAAMPYPGFPGFGALPYQDCVLQPGQMLYIPPGWWHYVRSMSASFSASFWWK